MTVEGKHVKTPPAQLQTAKEEEEEVIDDSHNWRGIGISLLVILGICSIIALAILLLTPKNSGYDLKGERILLSDIVDGNLEPRRFNGSWIADDKLEYRDKDGHLVIHYVRTKVVKRILDNSTFVDNVQKYSISADHNYVLLQQDTEKLYRYSFKAKYKIIDILNKKEYPLLPMKDPEGYIQYAIWGPKNNQLVYVHQNNIFYVPSVNDTHYQLTSNGVEGVIFNGVTDWLYGEELLKSPGALWFSPDGNFLCFACFNDTKVGTYYYESFKSSNGSKLYPDLVSLRYPKPGGENPAAFLWVVDIRSPGKFHQRDVKPPREVQDQDHYFTSVQWMDNESLAVIWMARSQNFSVVTQCTGTLWYCNVVYEQRPPSRRGWLDMSDPIFFGHGGRSWFLRLPLPEGYHGHFKHVAVVYNDDNKRVDYLTQGLYDIHKIVGYHEISNTVYYLSTIEGRPGERHLYSVSGKKIRFSIFTKCLTCQDGESCLYNNAIFSPSGEFYVLECLGPDIPKIEVRSIYNQTYELLDSNDELRESMARKLLPQVRTFQVPLKGDYKAQVRLFLPPELIEDEVLLYPLIVFTDSSPGSQLVSNEFKHHWGTYMSGRRNYIYALIDGRGTAYQGDKMMHEVYYQLGAPEVEDQIEVTRYLKENLPFIHPRHVAIWGWFYGGYVAATALAHEDTVFKCAMSVAPVTNWRFYDSTFSERYMGTPEQPDNYVGYDKSNLIKKANQFRRKNLLLVHGTADDKVHFQHSLLFMKALVDEGVIFHSQIYPDESHDLSNVRRHLYRTMEEYLNECFYSQRRDGFDNFLTNDLKTR